MRKAKSRERVDEFMAWAEAEKPKHRSKSPLGASLTYTVAKILLKPSWWVTFNRMGKQEARKL